MQIISDLVDISGADASLQAHEPLALRMSFSKDVRNKGMHSRCREEDCGIMFWDEGSILHLLVPLPLKEFQICLD